MADLGIDIACGTDISPAFGLASGRDALANALIRRLCTPRGGLWYDPSYGYDLRGRLNSEDDDADSEAMAREIESECEKDERVDSASAAVTMSADGAALVVAVSIASATGPFKLVVSADALTVELLRIEAAE